LFAVLVLALGAGWAQAGTGVYIYEHLEGQTVPGSTFCHAFSSAVGSRGYTCVDRVPLESNENVRILSEMTEGRTVVVTTLRAAWMGGQIVYPAVEMPADEIKFIDLSWHVDSDAVIEAATAAGQAEYIVGSISGQVTEGQWSDRQTYRVTAICNVQKIFTKFGTAVWTFQKTKTGSGFDPVVVYAKLVAELGAEAAASIE